MRHHFTSVRGLSFPNHFCCAATIPYCNSCIIKKPPAGILCGIITVGKSSTLSFRLEFQFGPSNEMFEFNSRVKLTFFVLFLQNSPLIPYLCTTSTIGTVIISIAVVDTIFLAQASIWVASIGTTPVTKYWSSSRRRPRMSLVLQLLQLCFTIGIIHIVRLWGGGGVIPYEGDPTLMLKRKVAIKACAFQLRRRRQLQQRQMFFLSFHLVQKGLKQSKQTQGIINFKSGDRSDL